MEPRNSESAQGYPAEWLTSARIRSVAVGFRKGSRLRFTRGAKPFLHKVFKAVGIFDGRIWIIGGELETFPYLTSCVFPVMKKCVTSWMIVPRSLFIPLAGA